MKVPADIVLASTSRYRRDLFARLGLPFRTRAPACDEDALRSLLPDDTAPVAIAAYLARAKADSVRDEEPGAVVLGSDQVAALDGRVLHKPGTVEVAVAQLTALAGREHVLTTAVAIAYEGRVIEHTDVTRLAMRPLSREQIDRYVAADAPLDCAGSYRLEARGITLFERIASADHTAIIGLPLIAVTSLLAQLGLPVP